MFINRKTLFQLSNIENDYSDFANNDFVIKLVENLIKQNFNTKNPEKYNVIYNEIMFELYEMSSNIEEFDDEKIEINI